ncbi:MAG: C2 family cysteine protease [archaeon]|nr:C2 family cysteine protease [archaeon]
MAKLDPMKVTKYYKDILPPEMEEIKAEGHFVDKDFPPELRSLISQKENGEFVDKVEGPESYELFKSDIEADGEDPGALDRIKWKRPSEVRKGQWSVFEDTVDCNDITQGTLGDCYFLSGIASLAKYQALIKEKFRTKEYNDLGYYELILFIEGEWQIVFVDDYFPYDPGMKDWVFAKPNGKELWVMLLEKAWAKANGGYTNIDGGFVRETWDAITGFPTEKINHIGPEPMDVFTSIKKASVKGHLMSCGSKADAKVTKFDLVAGHAYTLLAGKDWPEKDINLIQLRNPWGMGAEGGEWTGPWSDSDKKHWTEEAKEHFGQSDKNDGIFFMDLKDFLNYFDSSFICHLFFGAFIKTYYIDSDAQLKYPLVFNIKVNSGKNKFSIAARFKNQRFNRDLHNMIHPFAMLLFKYDDDRKVEKSYYKHCTTSDDTIVEKLEPGNYVLWVYCSHTECIMNDPYFKYKLLFYSKADYEVECVGIDKDFSLVKHLLLDNFKRDEISEGQLNTKDQVIVGHDKKLLTLGGLRAFLMYNKSNQWAKVKISNIDNDEVHMVPPFEGQNSFEIMVPPKGEECLLGMRVKKKKKYAKPDCRYTLDPKCKMSPPLKENFDKFMLMDISSKHDSNLLRNDAVKFATKENAKKETIDENAFNPMDIFKRSALANLPSLSKPLEEEFKEKHPYEMEYLEKNFPNQTKEKLKWDKIKSPSGDGKFLGQRTDPGMELKRGIYIWKETKGKYIGYFDKGLPNGKGVKMDKDNNIICEGNFVDGELNGPGKMYTAPNEYIEGDFKKGVLNGPGVYHFEDGSTWEGDFKDNMKNGVGMVKDPKSTDMCIAQYEDDGLISKEKIDFTKAFMKGFGKPKEGDKSYLNNFVKKNEPKQDPFSLVKIIEDHTKLDKNVLWIDPNNNKKENMSYAAKIKHEFPGMNFQMVRTVDEGYDILQKDDFKFKLIHVILSGKMSPDYMGDFINAMKGLNTLAANIIFCGSKDYWETKDYANHPFMNPGKVVDDFDDVKKYIMADETNFKETLKQPRTAPVNDYPEGEPYIVKKVDSDEDLAYPLLFPFLMKNNKVSLPKRKAFQEYVYSLGDPRLSKLVSPNNEKEMAVPNYVLSKYFLRMLFIDSDFKKEMNKDLSNNLFDTYRPYIYSLYNAEVNGDLRNNPRQMLYDTKLLDENTYNKIFEELGDLKKGSTLIFCSKIFDSFYPKEEIADKKMEDLLSSSDIERKFPVKFILHPLKNPKSKLNKYIVPNLNAEEFSDQPEEDEVVTLPFSCFKIVGTKKGEIEGEEITIIELEYLEDKTGDILEEINGMNEEEKKQFGKGIWNTDLASEMNMSEEQAKNLIGKERDESEAIEKSQDDLVKALKPAIKNFKMP